MIVSILLYESPSSFCWLIKGATVCKVTLTAACCTSSLEITSVQLSTTESRVMSRKCVIFSYLYFGTQRERSQAIVARLKRMFSTCFKALSLVSSSNSVEKRTLLRRNLTLGTCFRMSPTSFSSLTESLSNFPRKSIWLLEALGSIIFFTGCLG